MVAIDCVQNNLDQLQNRARLMSKYYHHRVKQELIQYLYFARPRLNLVICNLETYIEKNVDWKRTKTFKRTWFGNSEMWLETQCVVSKQSLKIGNINHNKIDRLQLNLYLVDVSNLLITYLILMLRVVHTQAIS